MYNIVYYNYGGIILHDLQVETKEEFKIYLKELVKLYDFIKIL
jgi:hypothetical protein